MAHFRGTVQGNREEASRLGSKSSGIETEAAGRRSGVVVRGFVDDNGLDVFYITATSGSGGNASDIYIGKVVLDENLDLDPRFIGAQKEN